MASKPENLFIGRVHKLLPPEIYHEKMANPYRGGTPDEYYEGPKGILWVEYKYLEKLPPKLCLTNLKGPTSVTPLQQKWLERAVANNVNACVILGFERNKVRIFRVEGLAETVTRDELLQYARPLSYAAEFIMSRTFY